MAQLCVSAVSAGRGPWPVPAVRATTGLLADPGDSKVYLEWNPGFEDGVVAGYQVRCRTTGGEWEGIGETAEPQLVCVERTNGVAYEFQVRNRVGDIRGPWSIGERATSHPTIAPRITDGPVVVRVPGNPDISLKAALQIVFGNGHKIVFDKTTARMRDWISPEGTHLLYPKIYGNAIDLGKLDNLGDYDIQNTVKQKEDPEETAPTEHEPYHPADKLNKDSYNNPNNVTYVGHAVRDNQVIIKYRIALKGHDDATIWETWAPAHEVLGIGQTSTYGGLTRKIEVQIPSTFDEGYVVCLHDGFGVNGSCAGGVSYDNHWVSKSNHTRPCIVETRWDPSRDDSVKFKAAGTWIQNQPYFFTDFKGKGTLVIASRRAYLATHFRPKNYVAQGRDGIWPNLRITCSQRGIRYAVETFEYLWAPEGGLALPQRYIDVKSSMMRRLARRYGLDPYLHATTHKHSFLAWNWDKAMAEMDDVEKIGFLAGKGAETLAEMKERHVNFLTTKYWTWLTGPALAHKLPFAGSDDIRLNPAHPLNRMLTDAWVVPFRNSNIRFGFHWAAPEEIRSDYPAVLAQSYDGKPSEQSGSWTPGYREWIVKQGFPLVRENPHWLRRGKDGTIPEGRMGAAAMTVPGGYYDQLVYQQWQMLKTMGFDSLFIGDGTCQLDGVDYSSGEPRVLQPFMWKMFRDIHAAGLVLHHELQIGFSAHNEHGRFNTDASEPLKWGVAHSSCGRHNSPVEPELRHRLHQLYCQLHVADVPEVADYAASFLATVGAPDRIFLEGTYWDNTNSKWEWTGVVWEYKNGKRIRYPNFDEFQHHPDITPPESPQGLSVAESDAGVVLEWTPVARVAGYNVYRISELDGSCIKLNTSLLKKTGYTSSAKSGGSECCYVAAAEDGNRNQSPYSRKACVELRPRNNPVVPKES